jgi:acetylglutamate kinase
MTTKRRATDDPGASPAAGARPAAKAASGRPSGKTEARPAEAPRDPPKTPSAPPPPATGANGAGPTAHVQARILAEALPHLIRYDEQTVVIKFGGHAMGDPALAEAFAKDIVYLKLSGINPIVVHGGGPQIAAMLKKLEIKSDFVHGLRVTDRPTVEVVEMVLSGLINKEIVSAINRQGGKAVGISGKDANLMIARQITEMPDPESNIMKAVDIGYVGDPVEVNPHIVEVISKSDLIPVIAPVGISREGQTLNINADSFASALAARMKAKRLLLLTDVAGVLDKDKKLIEDLTIEEARGMIRSGAITGGMIPKIEGCIEVVEAGVEAVVIIDGRVPHCVLLELFTEHGVGTIVRSRRARKG